MTADHRRQRCHGGRRLRRYQAMTCRTSSAGLPEVSVGGGGSRRWPEGVRARPGRYPAQRHRRRGRSVDYLFHQGRLMVEPELLERVEVAARGQQGHQWPRCPGRRHSLRHQDRTTCCARGTRRRAVEDRLLQQYRRLQGFRLAVRPPPTTGAPWPRWPRPTTATTKMPRATQYTETEVITGFAKVSRPVDRRTGSPSATGATGTKRSASTAALGASARNPVFDQRQKPSPASTASIPPTTTGWIWN
ncbi:hypothetical protein DSL92_05665 [Billgrantia gudaonensis]|uniref:Uncharacterized protein n=1 Tax=Billgrantia gudaonensis TaxID=376427 RepID=A0A432JIW7_9GAMM|nr:hypothetical protein DSL92_05665 [Halomonas gudaonensis]